MVFREAKNYGWLSMQMINWLESRKLEIEFVYLIVVIFAMNHGYKMLNDHFKIIWGVINVYLNWAQPRFHDHAWVSLIFESNVFV